MRRFPTAVATDEVPPSRHRSLAGLLVGLLCLVVATPAAEAWTDLSLWTVAEHAASIAPPDLTRLLERHEAEYRRGVLQRYTPAAREKVRAHLIREIDKAVEMIEAHHPFVDVSRQLGVVAHFVGLANEPTDPAAGWADDYRAYIESAAPRFEVIFYGFEAELGDTGALNRYLVDSLERRQNAVEVVAREYRRIGRIDGVGEFDDRSAAFGIAASSYCRALSDIAVVLRYIWLESGGADIRRDLPLRND